MPSGKQRLKKDSWWIMVLTSEGVLSVNFSLFSQKDGTETLHGTLFAEVPRRDSERNPEASAREGTDLSPWFLITGALQTAKLEYFPSTRTAMHNKRSPDVCETSLALDMLSLKLSSFFRHSFCSVWSRLKFMPVNSATGELGGCHGHRYRLTQEKTTSARKDKKERMDTTAQRPGSVARSCWCSLSNIVWEYSGVNIFFSCHQSPGSATEHNQIQQITHATLGHFRCWLVVGAPEAPVSVLVEHVTFFEKKKNPQHTQLNFVFILFLLSWFFTLFITWRQVDKPSMIRGSVWPL